MIKTKCFLAFFLFFLSFVTAANAQKLINGGIPKPVVKTADSESDCVNLPNKISVCKYTENPEDENKEPFGEFRIGKNGKQIGKIPAMPRYQGATSKEFWAFYGDLDKNNSAEIVIVEFTGQSNGLGVKYFDIAVLPDFETKGMQPAINFSTEEFGAEGTFIYDKKSDETLILITDWNGLENISKKEGTYFVGRFFRYQNGLLKPALDKPIYARRYLNSFDKQRWATEQNPLRPFLWLNTPAALKLKADPEFSVKPLKSEIGTIEKIEEITETAKRDDGETEKVTVKQMLVKFDSGATKAVVLYKSPEYMKLDSDKDKIFPQIFGIAPTNISLPAGISFEDVYGKIIGKKLIVNTYPPFSFDEEKKPRYKALISE